VNRVPYYQRLYQRNDGLRDWYKVRFPPIISYSVEADIVLCRALEADTSSTPTSLLLSGRSLVCPSSFFVPWILGSKLYVFPFSISLPAARAGPEGEEKS